MEIQKLSKIITTIGPASDTSEAMTRLIRAGANIFRFNMKHGTPEWHLEKIEQAQNAADSLNKKIGIMIDLKGPEIRIKTPDEQDVSLQKGEEVLFTSDPQYLPDDRKLNSLMVDKFIIIPQEIVIKALEKGNKFTIEDGFHSFEVIEKLNDQVIKVRIFDSGVISSNKSMNLVGKDLPLPSLIDVDLDKLNLAAQTKADFIALSFVRSKEDLITLREEIKKREMDVMVVSKIESQKGLDNIQEIIEYSDAIMIARGDLGIETPLEKLPYFQKEIIRECREVTKPVIVATQMLDSMIENPLPTRAEAADVAGAIYDGTDAILLSGETAIGKYPVKAVQVMTRIASFTESNTTVSKDNVPEALDQTHAIVRAALAMLRPFSGVYIDKLIVGTQTGYTARVFSSYRPKVPILALSNKPKTVETLTLSYGVVPIHMDLVISDFKDPEILIEKLKKANYLTEGETILLVHGKRIGDPGNTNSLTVLTVN